jgi:hypothetical protein
LTETGTTRSPACCQARHCSQARQRGDFGGDGADVDRDQVERQAAGLDDREIHQRSDQPVQAQGIPVRHLERLAPGRRQGVPVLFQQRAERAKDQGQRGAQFMARAGEELRAAAFQLGHRGAAARLGRIGFGDRHRMRDLARHRLQEAAVLRIEGTVGADAEQQHPGRRILAAAPERHAEQLPRGHRPGAAGPGMRQHGLRFEYFGLFVGEAARRAIEQPGDGRWRRRLQAGHECEGGRLARRRQDQGRQRQVVRVTAEGRAYQGQRLVAVAAQSDLRRDIGRRALAPLRQHAAGGIQEGHEDAADAPVGDEDRAVREGQVALFGAAIALQHQQPVVAAGRHAAGKHRFQHRTDDGPDFRPDRDHRLAQRPGMLVTEQATGCVVVEVDQLLAPQDRHLELGMQADPGGSLQLGRPAADRAQQRAVPVPGAQYRQDFAATCEQLGCKRFLIH